jgi:type IV secretion system protein VirB6
MATNFAVFADLFQMVDERTMNFATEISGRAVSAISPVVVVGLTLGFLMHGLLIVRGMVESPLMEFLGRSLKVALIVGVALGSGFYQGEIAGVIRTLPDEMASALMADTTGNGVAAANLVDQAAGEGFDKAAEAWEKANMFSGDGILYSLVGLLYLLFTVIVVAIGGSFILLAKIGLALLAGLGPLFIVSLAWQPTARFFEMWMGQVANFVLMVVLFSATFGFMMDIFAGSLEGVTIDDASNLAYNLGGLGILSVAMVIVLLQLPSLASGLASGVSMGTLHEMRAVAAGARAAGRAAGAGARGAGAGAKAGVAGVHAGSAGIARLFTSRGNIGAAGARAAQVAKGYYKNKGVAKAA